LAIDRGVPAALPQEAPARPRPREERWSSRLFYALAPRLPRVVQPDPPGELAPFVPRTLPRASRGGGGGIGATWFPAAAARGVVVLLPPWLEWGQAYLHRRGRVEALRAAGFHAWTVDFPGFGRSGPRFGYPDLDLEAALREIARQSDGLPLAVWGVSAGGYWAHPVLARLGADVGFRAAFFEDVSAHLIEWSTRVAPWGRPAFALFRRLFAASYRFLDARRHAAAFDLAAVAYVSGAEDQGVRPDDTAALARAARGVARVVDEAGHLGAIRRSPEELLALALETFERGVAAGPARRS
jgi:pimeloyl-ACP methyl ester carboxylesterase